MPATSHLLSIGPACVADARAIAEVHVRCWQQAYRGLLPDAYLAQLSVARREAMWLASLTRHRPEVLVARMGPEVLGFAAYGPPRDGVAAPGRAELWASYVDPACWSLGVGRALSRLAVDRLGREGAHEVSLWVFGENARAIRFFQRAGFEPDSARPKVVHLGGVPVRKVRHVLRLPTRDAGRA